MAECPVCCKFFEDIVLLQDEHIALCLSGDISADYASDDSGHCPVCLTAFASLHPSVVWDDHVDSCLRLEEQKLQRSQKATPQKKKKQTTLAFVDSYECNDASACSTMVGGNTGKSSSQKPGKSTILQIQYSSDDEFCAVKRHVKVLRHFSNSNIKDNGNNKDGDSDGEMMDCGSGSDDDGDDRSTDMWRLAAATNGFKQGTFTTQFLSKYFQDSLTSSSSSSTSSGKVYNLEPAACPAADNVIDNKLFSQQVNTACFRDIVLAKRGLDAKIKALRLEYNSFVRDCVAFRDLTISNLPKPVQPKMESETFSSVNTSTEDSFFDARQQAKELSEEPISVLVSNVIKKPTKKTVSLAIKKPKAAISSILQPIPPVIPRQTVTTIVISDDSSDQESPKKKTCRKIAPLIPNTPHTPPPARIRQSLGSQESPQISGRFQCMDIRDNRDDEDESMTLPQRRRSGLMCVEATPVLGGDFAAYRRSTNSGWVVEDTPSVNLGPALDYDEPESSIVRSTRIIGNVGTSTSGIIDSNVLEQNNSDEAPVNELEPKNAYSNDYEFENDSYDDGFDKHVKYNDNDKCIPASSIHLDFRVLDVAAAAESKTTPYRKSFDAPFARASVSTRQPTVARKLNALEVLMKSAASVASGASLPDSIPSELIDKGTKPVASKASKVPKSVTATTGTVAKKKKKAEEPAIKPDYLSMTVQDLEKIAGKYGIRKLPKSVLVDQLNKIWDTLYPTSVESVTIHPMESVVTDKQFPVPSATSTSKTTVKAIKLSPIVDAAPEIQAEEPKLVKPKAPRKKASSTTSVSAPETSTEQQIYEYIQSNEELYGQILRYKPLEFEALHQEIKANGGIKCSKKVLQSFLDARGITTQNNNASFG
ncbi:UNVERIFIED_CONTAM: hypothetical protein HDU68_010782 [Siphonaria sp. JEL0065]|nr:hypothetical protein HDU68_010782 [Siphonaria sp. JEL0065]